METNGISGAIARSRSRLAGIVEKRSGELWYTVGMASAPVVTLLAGVISAHYLEPRVTGVFTSIGLVPAYMAFLHLGVFTGAARNIPISRGAGDSQKADRLMRTSQAIANRLALGGVAFAFVWALWLAATMSDSLYMLAMLATIPALLATPIITHLDTTLRSYQEFSKLGKAMVLSSVAGALLTGLVAAFGVIGAALRVTLTSIAQLGARVATGWWKPSVQLEWMEARTLARAGFPLLLSGTFFTFLSLSDRSVVALWMSAEDVGLFTLSAMLVNSMNVIPLTVAMILFPAMAKEYGRVRSSRGLRRYFWTNLGINCVAIVPLSLIAYLLVEPVVRRYLPMYVGGIPAAKVACLTCVCWVYVGVGSIIGITNRMTPYLSAIVAAIALIWALGTWAIHAGYGIVGAAWARFAGTLLLCLFTLGYSYYLTFLDISPEA